MFQPFNLKAVLDQLADGSLSSVDLVETCLAHIRDLNPTLNAVLTVDESNARTEAKAADQRRKDGKALSPLDGLPVGLKDNIDAIGFPTTNGIGAWKDRYPDRDAEVTRRLRDAGTIIIAKLNMHEGALGTTTDNPWFGPCRNPHDPAFIPGGSSGGSGAAVASGMVPLALGTDTMGSVRLPAACCGVSGFKPSRGLVSDTGVVPLGRTLDHVGPIADDPAALAAVMSILAGYDRDCVTTDSESQIPDFATGHIDKHNIRFCVPSGMPLIETEDVVDRQFKLAIDEIREAGWPIDVIDLDSPGFGEMRKAGLMMTEAEAAVDHAETLRDNPEHFSDEYRSMLTWPESQTVTRLARAYATRRAVILAARRLFERTDFLLSPTSPVAPFRIGDPAPAHQSDYLAFANLAGLPAISIPFGTLDNGLPGSLQIIARKNDDARLLAAASEIGKTHSV